MPKSDTTIDAADALVREVATSLARMRSAGCEVLRLYGVSLGDKSDDDLLTAIWVAMEATRREAEMETEKSAKR